MAYSLGVDRKHLPVPTAPLAAVLLVLVLAYHGVAECGFVWDDDDYVTSNPTLRTWAGLWSIWTEPRSLPQYYPLVHTSFWLEWRLWGAHPLGYHLTNVALHGAAAVILARLLTRLAVPGAWAAALWFAAHPMHVESVAWVTERKNVLSLVCALAAANAYWRAREDVGLRPLLPALGWFLAALASKTVTATLPAALLVLVWWRDGRITRRDAAPLGAALGLGATAALGTAWLEAVHVGAAAMSDLHGAERILVAGRAPWHYLGSLLWPFGHCFHYPRWQLDAAEIAQWAWPAATAATLAAAWALRNRLGRSPLAVLLLFGGTLVPVLGFVDVYPFRFSFVADHFAYHASLPIVAGVAAAATRLARRIAPKVAAAAACAVAVGLALASAALVPEYRDEATLWQATLTKHPQSTLALSNLAGRALASGDVDAAERLTERALQADPANPESIANLGVIAHHRRDLAAAERHYERARALRPDFATNLRNLGALRHEQGRSEEALAFVQRALELDPEYLDGLELEVTLLQTLARHRECLAAAERLLLLRPEQLAVRLRAAEAALAVGETATAAHHAEAALRQAPMLEQARKVLEAAKKSAK
ncbi:MAG: O-GlcNAc transferase [Planctomycetota bacterium]